MILLASSLEFKVVKRFQVLLSKAHKWAAHFTHEGNRRMLTIV